MILDNVSPYTREYRHPFKPNEKYKKHLQNVQFRSMLCVVYVIIHTLCQYTPFLTTTALATWNYLR